MNPILPRGGARPAIALLAAVALAAGLASCADGATQSTSPGVSVVDDDPSREALVSYIEASRSLAEAELERYSDVYSNFTMTAEGSGTLVYEYTFHDLVDTGQVEAQVSSLASTLAETANSVIFPEMREVGVIDPIVRWVYLNADGTVIASTQVEG